MKKALLALAVGLACGSASAYEGHDAYEYAFYGSVSMPAPYVAPTGDMWAGHKAYGKAFFVDDGSYMPVEQKVSHPAVKDGNEIYHSVFVGD